MSDQQRDAAADLAVCAAATPGPWEATEDNFTDLRGNASWGVISSGGQLIACEGKEIESPAPTPDITFIALAREALPWWIQEALVRQAIIDGYSQAIDDQHAEIERLAAENARLKQTISNMEENL